MKISFHTDAFNTSFAPFDRCLEWAQENDVHWIECGLIDGVSWIHGLGYQPHVALYEDPVMLKNKMASYGVQFSQVDAAYPLSGKDGPLYGVPYVSTGIALRRTTEDAEGTEGWCGGSTRGSRVTKGPRGHNSARSWFSVRLPCSQLLVDVPHPPTVVAEP